MTRITVVSFVFVAFACGAAARNAQEDLITDVRELHEGLRWRSYDRAAAHVPAPQRERFLDAQEDLDRDVRVNEYEVERVTLTQDGTRAMIRVRYSWHLETVGRVHETIVDESWERQGKVWRITGVNHRRGEPFPPLAATAVESSPPSLP